MHYFYPKLDRPRKREKKFQSRIPFLPDPGQKIQKIKQKKIQKIKKHHFGIISIQTGMRQVEEERNKFQSRIPFLTDPGQKIQKKQQKNLKKTFRHYLYPKRDEIGQGREK